MRAPRLEVLVRAARPRTAGRCSPTTARSSPRAARSNRSASGSSHHVAAAEAVHEPEADHRPALAHQRGRSAPRSARGSRCRRRRGGRTARAPSRLCVEDLRRRPSRARRPPARRRSPRSARSVRSSRAGVHRGVGAQLERQLALLLRARGGDHAARAHRLRELHRQAAHAAGGRVDDHALALGAASRSSGRGARRSAPGSAAPARRRRRPRRGSGTSWPSERPRTRRSRRCRAAPPRARRSSARRVPATSPPGRQRQLVLREVRVLARCVSAKLIPARATLISTSSLAGLRDRRVVDQLEHLGAAELLDLDARITERPRLSWRRHEPRCRRIDRLRRGQDAVRRARAHARRLGRALLARGELLHRRARRRAGRRRLRRRRVRGAARARASTPTTSSASRAARPSSGAATTSTT